MDGHWVGSFGNLACAAVIQAVSPNIEEQEAYLHPGKSKEKHPFSDSYKLLITAQRRPCMEVDPILQMGSRRDLQIQDRRENLEGV